MVDIPHSPSFPPRSSGTKWRGAARARRRLVDGLGASKTLLAAVGLAVVAMLVLWLLWLGRGWTCPCGEVLFWQGAITPEQNSQQFSDWYSALHFVFGMGLFALIHRTSPDWTLGLKLLTAMAGSALWEAIENLPFVIALFNDPLDPLRYSGDSILNSLSDTLFVALGFFAASRLPARAALLLAVLAEATVTVAIHDGFLVGTLRIVRNH